MFNFVRIVGLTSKGIVGNQPTTKLTPFKTNKRASERAEGII